MSGVQIAPFLQQVIGVLKLKATGAVHLDFATRGRRAASSAAWTAAVRSALPRRLPVSISAGSPACCNRARDCRKGALGHSPRTDFTALSGTFALRNGVAQTGDLHWTTPTFKLTGVRSVNPATQQVVSHILPAALLGVAGVNLVDLGVPFCVEGTPASIPIPPVSQKASLVRSA